MGISYDLAKRHALLPYLLLTLLTFNLAVLFAACDSGGDAPSASPASTASGGTVNVAGGPAGVTFSWNAAKEIAVNSTGGGYYVSCSNPGAGATTVNVPYVSGPSTPARVTIPNLASGTHLCTVTAYSSLNLTGSRSANLTVIVKESGT